MSTHKKAEEAYQKYRRDLEELENGIKMIEDRNRQTRKKVAILLTALVLMAILGAMSSCATSRKACPQAYGYKNYTYDKPFINH